MPSFLHMLNQMGAVAMLSLLVAVFPAVMGLAYAIWPTESKLALMRPLSLASIFGSLAGFMGGAINGLHFAVVNEKPLTSATSMVGLAESLVPMFVAFGFLTIAWLLVALGMRRVA